jgi:hypothetical protein
MWYFISTGIGLSLVTTTLISKTINLSLDKLGGILLYMKNNEIF